MSNFSIKNKSEEFLIVNVNDPVEVDAADVSCEDSKAGKIAYEIFGMIPGFGTFIGIHHAYKAITSEGEVKGREIAKIFTQIFSFLILPQIIFFVGCGISDYNSRRASQYEFVNTDDTIVKVDAGDKSEYVDL